MNVTMTTQHTSTWLGRPGTLTTHHLDKFRDGLRIQVMIYNDHPTAQVCLVKGDGRKASFQILRSVNTPRKADLIDVIVESLRVEADRV